MSSNADKFDVTLFYGSDPEPALRRLVKAIEPFSALAPGARVVIKPNMVVSRRQWLGANTRPETVEALIVLLREHGVHDITVADGSGMGESATRAFKICGYTEIAHRHGVRLLDIERDRFVQRATRAAGPFSELSISKTVAECDYLINVPVIKAHSQTRVTCSLKNLKGVMPRRLKSGFHGVELERAIAQLADLVVPDLVIADGTYGDLTSELGGRPVNIGVVAAGYDPLAVDCFAAATLGFVPQQISHIAHYARARGVDLETFSPRLQKLNRPTGDRVFQTDTQPLRGYPCTVHSGGACCTCYGNLHFALERLSEAGLLQRDDHYYIGRGNTPRASGSKGRTVAVGDCAGRELSAAESPLIDVPGCPPNADSIVRTIRGAGR